MDQVFPEPIKNLPEADIPLDGIIACLYVLHAQGPAARRPRGTALFSLPTLIIVNMRGAYVIDLDISKYFDTIDREFLKAIARKRVKDALTRIFFSRNRMP